MRPLRTQAAGPLARPLAKFWRRSAPGGEPADHPSCVRPGHHPLRPGEQLRPTVRFGRTDLRPDPCHRPGRAPRRAGHLDEGRLRHVAGAVRRVELAEIPPGQPRSEPAANGPGVRRHLLLPPLRPGHAVGGDDGRARRHRPHGQSALYRHLFVFGQPHSGGRCDPAPVGHAASDSPTVVFTPQPMDRR